MSPASPEAMPPGLWRGQAAARGNLPGTPEAARPPPDRHLFGGASCRPWQCLTEGGAGKSSFADEVPQCHAGRSARELNAAGEAGPDVL